MDSQKKPRRFLRSVVLVFLSLTALITLLGGIGSSCVAFNAEKYGPKMAALIPVKPIFQVLVMVSIAAAVFGVYSIILLGKGRRRSFTMVLIFLLVGLVSSGIQYYYSATLRGSTAPNNMRLYITAFTLILFLLIRLPGLREKFNLEGDRGDDSGNSRTAGGAALFLCGLVTVTTPLWAAPTHLIDGVNTVYVLLLPLLVGGAGMITTGLACFWSGRKNAQKTSHQKTASQSLTSVKL